MSYPRLVFGFLIMVAGVLITLDNLGFLDAGDVLRFWPAALVLVGGLKLVERGFLGPGTVGGWLWIFAGAVLMLWTLDLVNPFSLLPLVLVVIGGRLVWHTFSPKADRAGRSPEGYVDGVAVLGGNSRSSNSQSFRGGDLNAFMGGVELDLREAAITESPAVIDVFAMWGGIEIKVPERWFVDPRVTALLGGFEDKTRGSVESGERLVIRGLVLMGGIEIKN
jgi:hypothetical protein